MVKGWAETPPVTPLPTERAPSEGPRSTGAVGATEVPRQEGQQASVEGDLPHIVRQCAHRGTAGNPFVHGPRSSCRG